MPQSLDTVIKFVIRTGKVVLGFRRTLKLVKHGKIRYIVVASNIPEEIRHDIEYYSRLSKTKILKFNGTNRELGALIGKPFSVSVIGIIDLGQIPSNVFDRFSGEEG